MGEPLWTPYTGRGTVLSTNQIASGGLPMQQPFVTQFEQQVRTPFALGQSNRPYEGVGKMTLNFAQPFNSLAVEQPAEEPKGIIEGFGAGAGRTLGGVFGEQGAQVGADIGQFLGGIGQAPLDFAAGIAGALPAIPGLPGFQIPGMNILTMSQEERSRVLSQWDGNPFSLFSMLGNLDQEEWQRRYDAGEIDPIFAMAGKPANSLGDQFMNVLGLAGVPSNMIQRAIAGMDVDSTVRRLEEGAAKGELNPEVQSLLAQYKAGEIKSDLFMDRLVMSGAGYSNNWVLNLLGEMVLDPANLLFGAGVAMKGVTTASKVTRAMNFADKIGATAAEGLAQSVMRRTLSETGTILSREAVSPLMLMEEAQRTGRFAGEIAAAGEQLSAAQKLALTPAWEKMGRAADVARRVLDPFENIGRRGSKPLANAYISREATKGVAYGYGLKNFDAVGDRLAALGKQELFDDGVGYFAAQEGAFMAGDSVARDVARIRNISDARPTEVALARAKVGAENYARRVEAWIGNRKADLARRTGIGTAEESMDRARRWAEDRLQKMGLSADEAAGVVKGLDADGLSFIDAIYYGNRIKRFNAAMTTARSGRVAKRAAAVMDRVTLIGSRELTRQRALVLRQAIDNGDAAAVRDAVRRYDRLGATLLADGPTDEEIITAVRKWLDDFEDTLTNEIDDATMRSLPQSLRDDLTDDGYTYGLRPEDGVGEYRLRFDENGNITDANPWIDIVSDKAEMWSLRFNGDGAVNGLMGGLERIGREMTRQITTDRIIREARQAFVDKAMNGFKNSQKTGLTYDEARGLFDAVNKKARDVGTTPRGLSIEEFRDIVKKSDAAKAVDLEARDLMLLTLSAYRGKWTTVGTSQAFTGALKRAGAELPMLPENVMGQIAERMFPLVRFSLNPFFQLQEWVEPWVFSAARGRIAGHLPNGGWINPLTGERVTLDNADMISQHLIDTYRASSPEAQFDMMERSLVYLHARKAAKDVAASIDRNRLQRALDRLGSPGDRKYMAQQQQFRDQLGVMLRRQFDQINPQIWRDLSMEFGTTDDGLIALRWMTEKDKWATADPNLAGHIMQAQKARFVGSRGVIDMTGVARVGFNTTHDALVLKVQNGTLDRIGFAEAMEAVGASGEYVGRAWKTLQFDARTGGVDKWWDDFALSAGKESAKQNRTLVQVLAETQDISETELLSRTMQDSPMSLWHDDLIGMPASDIAAMGGLLQEGVDVAHLYERGPMGRVIAPPGPHGPTEAEFRRRAQQVPSGLDGGQVDKLQRVPFGKDGRTILIPGGKRALMDVDTPWTEWEAHVIRSQMINPGDLKDKVLADALYRKAWRGHVIDMADPASRFRVYNNIAMAMTSSGLNLTKNEMIALRLRAVSNEALDDMAAEADVMVRAIEDAGDVADAGSLGIALSARPQLGGHIPLDSRKSYYGRATKSADTEAVIERRARVTSAMLQDISRTKYDRWVGMAGGNPKKVSVYTEWATDRIIEAVERDGMDGLERLSIEMPELGITRAAKVKDPDSVLDAVKRLAGEEYEDATLREQIAALVDKKALDDLNGGVVLRKYNVHGASSPYARTADGIIGHGETPLYAYIKNPDVTWRNTRTNEVLGRMYMLARDMRTNPDKFVRRTVNGELEPLSHFAERISHRTDGLALKTSYFGADLGDPINFEHSIMDIHMVGDITEWMYHDVAKGDITNPRWTQFYESLTPEKRRDIDRWIKGGEDTVKTSSDEWKDYYDNLPTDAERAAWDAKIKGKGPVKDGKPTDLDEVRINRNPAERRAVSHENHRVAFAWKNAEGKKMSIKSSSAKTKETLDTAVRDGDVATLANYARKRIRENKGFTDAQKERLLSMYHSDADLADIVGRDIDTLSGDYDVYERLLDERKAIESVDDPTLLTHGNGGYQWKLWDERRGVFDPEIVTFARSHTMQPRDVRFTAMSDDVYKAAGIYGKRPMPSPLTEGGSYSYLDPVESILYQRDPKRILGATLMDDMGNRIIGFTKYRNKTTGTHELVHAVIEPLLDPSGKQVVLDDINEIIRRANDDLILQTGERKVVLQRAEDLVRTLEGDLATATRTLDDATKHAADRADALAKAEREASGLTTDVATQQGVLRQMQKDAAGRRRMIEAQKLPPSRRKVRLEAIDNGIARQQKKVDALVTKRDAAKASLPSLKAEVEAARNALPSLRDNVAAITPQLGDAKKAGEAARKAYDDVATAAPRQIKGAWDREVSEHLADEFLKWLATGKAKNSKLRDLFAYMRRAMLAMNKWLRKNPNAAVSPEMDELFQSMTKGRSARAAATSNPVPFDATQEMMHAAGIQSVIDAEDAAFTNVQFRRGRSWIERSVNHPYFGIYPASYMWGKVAPEIIRSLAKHPFGMPIYPAAKALLRGETKVGEAIGGRAGRAIAGAGTAATAVTKPVAKMLPEEMAGAPFWGFVNAQRVWSSVEMQKDTDPEFAAMMNDPENEKVFRNMSMFLPSTPWDMPANFPLWMRRYAEWGLESQVRVEEGKEPKSFDMFKTAGEVASYAFGPKATFDWISDTFKIGNAPMFNPENPADGLGEASSDLFVIGPGGSTPLQNYLQGAQTQLQQQLGE